MKNNLYINFIRFALLFLLLSAGRPCFSQSYLPLTGGTLTGNLVMSSGTQIQLPYLSFNTAMAPPSSASHPTLLSNSTANTLDIVGGSSGWQFIPPNGSSYLSPVVKIDQNGNLTTQGQIKVDHPSEVSGFAYGMRVLPTTQSTSNTSEIDGLQIGVTTAAGTYTTSRVNVLDISGYMITKGAGQTITNAQGIVMGSLNVGTNNCNLCMLLTGTDAPPTGNYAIYNNSSYNNFFSGSLGIGTSSPANKLDVQGGNASVYNTGAASSFYVGSGATGKTNLVLSTSADASGYGLIQSVSVSGSTYGNTVINPSGGNILIGKTSQVNTAYILDVNGSARVNQVVVNTSGADFVFTPAYHLKSLENVEKYIEKNHRLPEIASAKEMQTNGLNVGDTETKLLQKVEELTLYMIALQKQVKEQQKEITRLKTTKHIAGLK